MSLLKAELVALSLTCLPSSGLQPEGEEESFGGSSAESSDCTAMLLSCLLPACPLQSLQLLVSLELCTEGREAHSLSAASWRWGWLWLIVIAIEIGLHGV